MEEYDNIIKEFKPEFGNKHHIQALDNIKNLKKMETILKRKIDNGKAGGKLLEEVENLKSHIIFNIKGYKQTKIKH